MIEDRKIATSYAIEAIRLFDQLQFRGGMADNKTKGKLFLKKPAAISGADAAWFAREFIPDSQRSRDRLLLAAEII